MGCFDYRCAISGLPLKWGDPLRFALLTESVRDGERKTHKALYLGDWWSPRTLPLKGKYNDYGGVEELQEGPCRDIWVELLRRDVVEKGTGDNQCHDVPVNSDMDLEGFLEALMANRLEVYRSGVRPNTRDPEQQEASNTESPEWRPTIRSVTALLPNPDEFLVDDLEPGVIRVRCAGFCVENKLEALEALRPILHERFVSVVTAGSGNYSFGNPELRVFPPPIEEASVGHRDSPLPITQRLSFMMIREDVWQALLKIPLTVKPTGHTLEAFKKEYLEAYQKLSDTYRQSEEMMARYRKLKAKGLEEESAKIFHDAIRCVTRIEDYNEVPRMVSRWNDVHAGALVGIRTHWSEFVKKQLPVEVAQEFIDSAAEMAYVCDVLDNLQYRWIPSTYAGQGCSFQDHVNFFSAILEVAVQCVEKKEAEYKEY